MDQYGNDFNNSTPQMNEQPYGTPPQQFGGQQPYVQPQQQNESGSGKGLATASMILGIIGVVFGCCVGALSILPGGVALGLGIAALAKKTDGRGMAIAGVVMGALAILFALIWIILVASGATDAWIEELYNF